MRMHHQDTGVTDQGNLIRTRHVGALPAGTCFPPSAASRFSPERVCTICNRVKYSKDITSIGTEPDPARNRDYRKPKPLATNTRFKFPEIDPGFCACQVRPRLQGNRIPAVRRHDGSYPGSRKHRDLPAGNKVFDYDVVAQYAGRTMRVQTAIGSQIGAGSEQIS